MTLVRIDTRRIKDWDSFHAEFSQVFGFPPYYGRNMNAWIDCMTYLNDPDIADTQVKAAPGDVVTIQLDHVSDFRDRCPEIYDALVESSAFVNWRRLELGDSPVIALSFHANA
jgi:RNAse (barnase) inhibitor barstar